MRAIVLNSGGIDSTVCLGIAVDTHGSSNVLSLQCDYGQKHIRELEAALNIASYYKVRAECINLRSAFCFSNSSLLMGGSAAIESTEYKEQSKNGKVITTTVPMRNGVIFTVAASVAMSVFPGEFCTVYTGIHDNDSGYADCSSKFIDAINQCVLLGTNDLINVIAPFAGHGKTEIVAQGVKMNMPFELTRSCYNGMKLACGKCATCRERLEAFAANGITDPIQYEDTNE